MRVLPSAHIFLIFFSLKAEETHSDCNYSSFITSLQQAVNQWSFFRNLNKQGFLGKRFPHGKYQAQPIFSIQRGSCKAGKRLHSSLQSCAAYLLQCKSHMLFTVTAKPFFCFTHTTQTNICGYTTAQVFSCHVQGEEISCHLV